MNEEITKLLIQEWAQDEKPLITKALNNLVYYKSFIPKSIKNDIIDVLKMANNIKQEYTIIKKQNQIKVNLQRRNSI